jgi:hypothetical protein
VEVSPTSIDFDYLPVGETTPSAPVTVTNGTAAPILLVPPTLEDDLGFSVEAIPEADLHVDPGASTTFGVTFTPREVAGYQDRITVADATGALDVVVKVRGEGFGPQALPIPAEYDFGSVAPGETPSFTLELTNRGTADLTVASVAFADPAAGFVFVDPDAVAAATGTAVAPGGEATFAIGVAGGPPGRIETDVIFVTNDPAWPEARATFSATLTGP